ncbi:retrovirus-related pol polyprotein from transposon TNT 1-94 [Tanacetum coccineum]
MKVKESLNVTFDESPPPTKLSPLVDDDVGEEEAIENNTKVVNNSNVEDESIEVDEVVNIKESKNHPLEQVIGNLNQRTLRLQAQNHRTKWVYRNKLDENNIVSRNKAGLVAQGYKQQEGIDYDETYAPIASRDKKPEIGEKVAFEIKSQLLRELRDNTFSGNKTEDAMEHLQKILDSRGLIPGLTDIEALKLIQEMAYHSNKQNHEENDRKTPNKNSNCLSTIVEKLRNLNHEMNNLRKNIHKIHQRSSKEFRHEEVKSMRAWRLNLGITSKRH